VIPQIWQEFLNQQRKQSADDNLGRKLRLLRHQAAGRVLVGSQELVNFSSNDYLGLAGDLRIAEAAARAAGRFGWGAGASRVVTGTSILHNELENAVAKFRGTDAALVFGSGYQANLGVISALAGSGDTVFSDAMNHSSIIAACRLSGAEVRVYKHFGYDELERQLNAAPATGKRMIVSDSLFSVEGDVVDCARLLKLSEKFNALLVLDDAHANGVLGKRGRGVSELQEVSARIDVVTASFSKALGSFGGFVACSREVREFLINSSRPFIYTTAMPITLAAANLEALRIVTKEGEALRQKLAGLVRTLRTKLGAAGFEPKGEHQIIPIPVGDEEKALQYSEELEHQGMLVHPMRYPTVPKGKAMLRVSVSAAHTDDDVYRLVNAFKAARDKVSGKGTGKVTRREAKRPEADVTVEVTDDSTMSGLNFDEVKALVAEAMADSSPEKKTDKLPVVTEKPPEKPAEPAPAAEVVGGEVISSEFPAIEDEPTSQSSAESIHPEVETEQPPITEELPRDTTRKTKTIKRATRIHKKV
jgi:8-amino-7-oxononanoate synthase